MADNKKEKKEEDNKENPFDVNKVKSNSEKPWEEIIRDEKLLDDLLKGEGIIIYTPRPEDDKLLF